MDGKMKGINYFGTDGIRGKTEVQELSFLDAINLFRQKAVITPALIELAAKAFAKLIGATSESVFVSGSDGRDSVTGNTFVNALNRGFSTNRSKVLYLGVVPTPTVPQFQLENGCLGGAMLTASHNPSNQNGIKFFYKGKKLLPEGSIGDKSLSALMFQIAKQEQFPAKEDVTVEKVDSMASVIGTLRKNVPTDLLKDAHFIVDTAAGAWTRYADEFFSTAGLKFTRISEDEKGFNINRNCGVAEIEGHDFYHREDIPYSPAIVRILFENPQAYGIVTDGDGDRGMLLRYDSHTDSVRVYDGDDESFLILGLFEKTGKKVNGSTIVCTLESDIMASVSFAKQFNCKTVITDVGDKWISSCGISDYTIGFESSGHVIIPMKLDCAETLHSGNGLLTALLTAAAIEVGCNTFDRGFSKTFYTYFVDKTLFGRDTALFVEDSELLAKALSEAISGIAGLSIQERRFKDDNVLAYEVLRNRMTIALVVSRNSGTEDKNAVYLKCVPELAEVLKPVEQQLAMRHRERMRNHSHPDMEIASLILDEIRKQGQFVVPEQQHSDTRLISVLHALEREDRIKGDGFCYRAK